MQIRPLLVGCEWIAFRTVLDVQTLIREQVGFVTYCGIAIAIGNAGAGRHQWDVSVASIIRIGLLGNVIEIVYGPTIWLAKLSVLLQYKHIFTPTKKPGIVYWSIHALIWGNFLFYFADTLVVILECRPRAKIWNFLLPGTCLNGTANFIVTGAWNVLSDWFILGLPLYAIWQLKMPLRRKVSVGAVFATGLFACIASIVRLCYTVKWARTQDATYVFMQVALWGLAELATVVLCGSVIFLPKFVQLVRGPDMKASSSHQTPPSSERSRQLGSRPLVSNEAAPWAEVDHPIRKPGGRYIPLQEVSIKHDSWPKVNTNGQDSVAERSIMRTIDIETDRY